MPDDKDPIDCKDPIIDADDVREHVRTAVERVRQKLPEVLQDENIPIPPAEGGDR